MECPAGVPSNVPLPRRPRLLLAVAGYAEPETFTRLCILFTAWAEVRAVIMRGCLEYIDRAAIPSSNTVRIYKDKDEMSRWNGIGDNELHVELSGWADMMVIAPLSAESLGKIAAGLSDSIVFSMVRAWDLETKPLFVAPRMDLSMWLSPYTKAHLEAARKLGIKIIKTDSGALGDLSRISKIVDRRRRSFKRPPGAIPWKP